MSGGGGGGGAGVGAAAPTPEQITAATDAAAAATANHINAIEAAKLLMGKGGMGGKGGKGGKRQSRRNWNRQYMRKTMKTRKTRKTRKATKGRPSPTESATAFPEGTIRVGGNKGRWVVTKTRAGVKRWTLYENASVGDYKPLTVDVLCKNKGKPIKVYERSMKFHADTWPTGPKDFDTRYEITPTGDLTFGGKLRSNWIETQKPRLPSGTNEVMGTYSSFGNYKGPIHVDPITKCLVSSNVDNTEAFVKI